jgi:hypothetical protein
MATKTLHREAPAGTGATTRSRLVMGSAVILVSVMVPFAGQPGAVMSDQPSTKQITAEYLLAHGFRRAPGHSDLFVASNVKLSEISRALGFRRDALRPTAGLEAGTDSRSTQVGGVFIEVTSSVQRVRDGAVLEQQLDQPDAVCRVSVLLRPRSQPKYASASSRPRMQVISATTPVSSPKTLEVTFAVTAEGKGPVSFKLSQIGINISRPNVFENFGSPYLVFRKDTPNVIILRPGQAQVVLTAVISGGAELLDRWQNLAPGKYDVSVSIGNNTKALQSFDYQWKGHAESDLYPFAIPSIRPVQK